MLDLMFADIEREVRRKVAANPEFVYRPSLGDSCSYTRDDGNGGREGDCLFGQALVACGVPPEALAPCEDARIGLALARLGIAVPPEKLVWARAVQRKQDRGKSWGDALSEADAEFPSSESPAPGAVK